MRTAKNSIRCLNNDHDDRIEGADWIKVYVVQVYKRPAKRDQSRDIAKGVIASIHYGWSLTQKCKHVFREAKRCDALAILKRSELLVDVVYFKWCGMDVFIKHSIYTSHFTQPKPIFEALSLNSIFTPIWALKDYRLKCPLSFTINAVARLNSWSTPNYSRKLLW